MGRFSVVVDKPFNIKPDTLLLTTSITYNVQQATRLKKMCKMCSSFDLKGLHKTGYPEISVYSNFQLAGNSITQIVQTGF
jgi:hypothetical protein